MYIGYVWTGSFCRNQYAGIWKTKITRNKEFEVTQFLFLPICKNKILILPICKIRIYFLHTNDFFDKNYFGINYVVINKIITYI